MGGQAVNAKLDPAESKGAAGCACEYTSHFVCVRDIDPKVFGDQHSGAPFVEIGFSHASRHWAWTRAVCIILRSGQTVHPACEFSRFER